MTRIALIAAALLAVIHATGQQESIQPAQPFWQMQGAAPGAREADAIDAMRAAARQDAEPETILAAR
jgi:hypothetical protein